MDADALPAQVDVTEPTDNVRASRCADETVATRSTR
jgi:hypothetical protein